jgi:sulfur relay (sulfurtransferase) complex TusBCD TusD component (DsrE family)
MNLSKNSLLIFLCDSPFQNESVDKVLQISSAAIKKGKKVNIFLMMDGVYAPLISQSGASFDMQSISEKIQNLISKGAKIAACGSCMELRGVKEDMLPEGVAVGGLFDLSNMITESDVILNFIGM